MLAVDRDALVCDLAETYGILDMYEHPAQLIATLATGLRENSRIYARIRAERQNNSTDARAPVLRGYATVEDFDAALAAFEKGGE